MMLADNGSPWFISGAPDERWNNDVLHELHRVHGSDFEAVDVSSLMVDPDSGQVRRSTTPTPTPTYPACFLTGTVRDQSGTYYLEEAGRLLAFLYGESVNFPAYLGQRVTVGGPCRVWRESAGPRPVFLAQTIMLANQPAKPAAKTAKGATGVW